MNISSVELEMNKLGVVVDRGRCLAKLSSSSSQYELSSSIELNCFANAKSVVDCSDRRKIRGLHESQG